MQSSTAIKQLEGRYDTDDCLQSQLQLSFPKLRVPELGALNGSVWRADRRNTGNLFNNSITQVNYHYLNGGKFKQS